MKLSTAVADFMRDVRIRLARQTQQNYESDLGLLISLASVEASDSVLAFTPDLVRTYFMALSKKGLSMATLHRRRATISEFARWGLRRRLWASDPMLDAPAIRRPRHLPRPFSKRERARLLGLALPLKERLIRALLYYTGLRVTPICQIRLGDIWTDEQDRPTKIRTVGKGRREHWVYVVPELREVLSDYLLQSTNLDPKAYLFGPSPDRPAHRKMIERYTRAWGRLAEVPDCQPHRWRHTYATELLERGVDIRKIQKLLAHADISTTMLYVEVTDRALEEAAMRISDRPEACEGR